MAFSLPSFPVNILPENLACFVKSSSKAIGCPADFIGVFVLTTLSAAIGTARCIRVKDGWIEPLVLYSAVVAPPASKKSPAFKLTLRPVLEKQTELKHNYLDHKAQFEVEFEHWEKDKKTAAKPNKPLWVRNYVNDFTFEGLAKILQHNPKGLLLGLDEVAAWVKSMDQYRKGRGSDREKWLSMWTCNDIIIDRASYEEPILIPQPFVSVTGGIQPDRLKLFRSNESDGFIDRILFSFPEPITDCWVEDSVSPVVLAAYKKLYDDLYDLSADNVSGIQTKPLVLDFSKEAKKGFINFYSQNISDINSEVNPTLKSTFKKIEAYTARFALLLQLCHKPESLLVEAQAVEGAAILGDYFKAHSRKVYAHLNGGKIDDRILKAVEIMRSHGNEITLRECYTKGIVGCKSAASATKLFNDLKEAGYGTVLQVKNASGGRSTVIFRFI